MARCKNCNQVFSDTYLIDGICEDCIEEDKKYKELNSEQIKLKEMLSSKYDLTLNSFLKAKEEVEKLKSIHNIDIDIENYLLIKKNITPFENTLLQKRKELVTLDSYGNNVFDTWHNEIDYFIKNLNIDNKSIYESIIKNIIIIEIEEKILSAKNENSISNILSTQTNANPKNLTQSTKIILGSILAILIIWIMIAAINSKVANDFEKQYNVAVRQGNSISICVQAGLVSAAYLQANDEMNYRKWKSIEKNDCARAGIN